MYSILIAASLTLGFIDLSKYFIRVNGSTKQTLKVGCYLFIFEYGFTLVGLWICAHIFGIIGPQGIATRKDTTSIFLQEVSLLPWITVGEEFFKILVFLGALACLTTTSPKLRIALAILISTLAFGYAHAFNYKLAVGFPIALSAIPSYIFLLKYKSIYPLIISHLIFDLSSFTMHWENNGELIIGLVPFSILVIFTYRAIAPLVNGLFKRKS